MLRCFLLLLFVSLIPATAQQLVLPGASSAAGELPLAKFEPDSGYIYHGVGGGTSEINAYVAAMDSMTQPLLIELYFDLPGSGTPPYATLRSVLAQEKAIGRFPVLSIDMTDKVIGTDSIIATTTRYDAIIDSIASICKAFGRRIFIRPGFEFNGPWNGYHPYLYPKAFRKIVDRFRALGAADSAAFIWCYYPSGAPNDFDASNAGGSRWYPGDGYVDWFGIDLFFTDEFDVDLPDSDAGGITLSGKTNRFLEMASSKGKPVLAAEVSAAGVDIIPADSVDGLDDWYAWFDRFIEFLDVHREVKGFCYFNTDWGGSWGNARISDNPVVLDYWIEEMLNPWYIHLRNGTTPPPVLTAPFLLAPADSAKSPVANWVVQWGSSRGATLYHLQLATTNTFVAPLVDDSSLVATSFNVGPLAPGRYYWHVSARNADARSPWSETWSFLVTTAPPQLPARVTLASPAMGSVVGELEAKLLWLTSAPNVDRYWVEFATDSTLSGAMIDTAVTDTAALRANLIDGKRYWWRVRAHNTVGWGEFSPIWSFLVNLEPLAVPDAVTGVAGARLEVAPNPVRGTAALTLRLASGSSISIALIDELGRTVREIASERLAAGAHHYTLDANDLAAGPYFCRVLTTTGTLVVPISIVH